MMTHKQLSTKLEAVPAATSWYLADLGEEKFNASAEGKMHSGKKREKELCKIGWRNAFKEKRQYP